MQHSCDMPLNKLWHDYNESLVERSSISFDVLGRPLNHLTKKLRLL